MLFCFISVYINPVFHTFSSLSFMLCKQSMGIASVVLKSPISFLVFLHLFLLLLQQQGITKILSYPLYYSLKGHTFSNIWYLKWISRYVITAKKVGKSFLHQWTWTTKLMTQENTFCYSSHILTLSVLLMTADVCVAVASHSGGLSSQHSKV